jgi:hypothetical protein
VQDSLPAKAGKSRVNTVSTLLRLAMSNTRRKSKNLISRRTLMLAVVIVAAVSLAGVIAYILYLTPGPKDQI